LDHRSASFRAVFARRLKWFQVCFVGVSGGAIGGGMTHTIKPTTLRYIRRRAKKIDTIAEAHKQSRTADDGGGTAQKPRVSINRKTSESQRGKSRG
jgi:hypothetical protein